MGLYAANLVVFATLPAMHVFALSAMFLEKSHVQTKEHKTACMDSFFERLNV